MCDEKISLDRETPLIPKLPAWNFLNQFWRIILAIDLEASQLPTAGENVYLMFAEIFVFYGIHPDPFVKFHFVINNYQLDVCTYATNLQ